MRDALSGRGATGAGVVAANLGRNGVDEELVARIQSAARQRWEYFLQFMVDEDSQPPSRAVVRLLVQTGLMQSLGGKGKGKKRRRNEDEDAYEDGDADGGEDGEDDDAFEPRMGSKRTVTITNAGYQFLMRDVYSQVWTFVKEFAKTVRDGSTGADEQDVLVLLFHLSFMELGRAYYFDSLPDVHQRLVRELVEFGLVFMDDLDDAVFFPTQFAINLAAASAAGVGATESTPASGRRVEASAASERELMPTTAVNVADEEHGFLILETNMQIYAYTSSALQRALLRLFSNIRIILPNMVTSEMTRDSVQSAFARGITADQIIEFLKQNAHPFARTRADTLPQNVCDQIRLWADELTRVTYDHCRMYDQFDSLEDFIATRNYARDLGYLLVANEEKRVLVLESEGHAEMVEFIRGAMKRR